MSEQSERLFSALSQIREEHIDQAARWMSRRPRWRRWTALAACLVLLLGLGYVLPRMGGNSGGSGSASVGADGGTIFQSYAGPIFPLTLREECGDITAQRAITLDFAPWVPEWVPENDGQDKDEGGYYQSSTSIQVTDAYTLTNAAKQEQTVKVLYPFAGQLLSLYGQRPTLEVDGVEQDTTLYAGGYSGGFEGAWGEEESGERLNLDALDSWEDYQHLLEDGNYQKAALGPYPNLSGIPVVLYTLTDPWCDESTLKEGENGAITVETTFDPSQTRLLSYGFHFGSYDWEHGQVAQGFSIREPGDPRYEEPYYILVVGEDVDTFQLTGDRVEDKRPDVKVGAAVDRRETDLDTALREVAAVAYGKWQDPDDPRMDGVSFEMYYGLLCDYLLTYGGLSQDPVERNDTGFLEDLNVEAMDRIFYLEGEVTIPAGESINLTFSFLKGASYNYYSGYKQGERDVYGYDLTPNLGTNLIYTGQQATLEDRGQIAIIRENFGFDLEAGIQTVELNPEVEHYYLEVQPVKQH